MIVTDKPFQPSLIFAGEATSLPRVEHLKVVSLTWAASSLANKAFQGQTLYLIRNIFSILAV